MFISSLVYCVNVELYEIHKADQYSAYFIHWHFHWLYDEHLDNNIILIEFCLFCGCYGTDEMGCRYRFLLVYKTILVIAPICFNSSMESVLYHMLIGLFVFNSFFVKVKSFILYIENCPDDITCYCIFLKTLKSNIN